MPQPVLGIGGRSTLCDEGITGRVRHAAFETGLCDIGHGAESRERLRGAGGHFTMQYGES